MPGRAMALVSVAEAGRMPLAAVDTRARDLALRLTSIVILLRPMGSWYLRPAILGLAALTLVSGTALRRPAVWLALAVLIGLRIADDWPLADNHIYLLSYWCLAAAIAVRPDEPIGSLAWSGRTLIGLSFACAIVWKLALSPDFVDGRFFRVTLLTDPRFVDAAQLLGGLSDEQIERNQKALEPWPDGAERIEPSATDEPPRFRAFVRTSTWGIVVLEGAIAFLMLLPPVWRLPAFRHAALLVFCLTTYAFAPVAGFGWLLTVMGLSQVEPRQTWLRRVYVGLFLLILLYAEVPWVGLMVDLSKG